MSLYGIGGIMESRSVDISYKVNLKDDYHLTIIIVNIEEKIIILQRTLK